MNTHANRFTAHTLTHTHTNATDKGSLPHHTSWSDFNCLLLITSSVERSCVCCIYLPGVVGARTRCSPVHVKTNVFLLESDLALAASSCYNSRSAMLSLSVASSFALFLAPFILGASNFPFSIVNRAEKKLLSIGFCSFCNGIVLVGSRRSVSASYDSAVNT